MRTLHFIYSGNPLNDKASHPPEAIANKIYRRFEHDFNIKYYDWTYSGPFEVHEDDIVLGHPHWGADTIMRRIFMESRPLAKYLIFPFHTAMPEINYPFNDLVMSCDKYFAITGEYWYNTIVDTKFANWLPKMVRLDNAIDINQFPFKRIVFHDPGERVLFYIGRDGKEKGIKELAEVIKNSGYKLYMAGLFSNESRAYFDGLDVSFLGVIHLQDSIQWIINHCDVFINMSVSDANPTTILEMAAIGMPVLATPQSGYSNSRLLNYLSLTDMKWNMRMLRDYQFADSSCLHKIANIARKEADEYTWSRFLDPIEKELEKWA